MLDCGSFYDALVERGIRFFAGVPDSLLKHFCAYVTDHCGAESHVITANEGCAVALASGSYLATGQPALVYMQNSGLGNAVNPLTSLADPDVYGIPMLLLIGWRGEPGRPDEPQHVKMGRVMLPALSALGVEHAVLPDSPDEAMAVLDASIAHMRARLAPVALVVRKGTFGRYALQREREAPYQMSREEAVEAFVEAVGSKRPIVSTTGKPSRELFEVRERRGESHDLDFLTVGSMGHSSQIALGVALRSTDGDVFCLDGDGAALMHLGGLATIGSLGPANYKHVVLNNGVHDSVGGQPTVAFDIDLCAIARACGYKAAYRATTLDELRSRLEELRAGVGPALLEVRVKKGARSDLGRPTMSPRELKQRLMRALGAPELP